MGQTKSAGGVAYVMQPVNMLTIPFDSNDNNFQRNNKDIFSRNLFSPYSDRSNSLFSPSPVFPTYNLPFKNPNEQHSQPTAKMYYPDYHSEFFKNKNNDIVCENKSSVNLNVKDNNEDNTVGTKISTCSVIERCDNSTPSLESSSPPHTITSFNSNNVYFFFGEDKIENDKERAKSITNISKQNIEQHKRLQFQKFPQVQQPIRPPHVATPSPSPYFLTPFQINSPPQLSPRQPSKYNSIFSTKMSPGYLLDTSNQHLNQIPIIPPSLQQDQEFFTYPSNYISHGHSYVNDLPQYIPAHSHLFIQPQHQVFYQHNQITPCHYQQKHQYMYALNQPQAETSDKKQHYSRENFKITKFDRENPEFNVYPQKRHNSLNMTSKHRMLNKFSSQRNSLTDEKLSKANFKQTLKNVAKLRETGRWNKNNDDRCLQPTAEESFSPTVPDGKGDLDSIKKSINSFYLEQDQSYSSENNNFLAEAINSHQAIMELSHFGVENNQISYQTFSTKTVTENDATNIKSGNERNFGEVDNTSTNNAEIINEDNMKDADKSENKLDMCYKVDTEVEKQ